MIKPEKLNELIEKEAMIYYIDCFKNIKEFKLDATYMITYDIYNQQEKCLGKYNGSYIDENNEEVEDIDRYDFEDLFEIKSEAEFYSKYGNVEKTVKMPVPPTWEETKIKDFIKSNKTKPDNYKELFAFYLNNELFNLEIYSDENCKYFITISDDKNYYKPLFKMPLTKDNYYKALDKMVELWKEEV